MTALLIYFGRYHANGFTEYYGLHYSTLEFTVQDYLVRSADGVILPAVFFAIGVLLALWGHQVLSRMQSDVERRTLLVLIPSAIVLGLGMISAAMVDALGVDLFGTFGEGRGLCLAIGAPVLAYAARLARHYVLVYRRRRTAWRVPDVAVVAEWAAVFILVSVGLFWAAGTYAAGVGRGRAVQLQGMLPSWPEVTVFSDKDLLILDQPGVEAARCHRPDQAFAFRYSGLRLVLQAGNQYLILPSGWTPDHGSAILLSRRDGLRFEFSQTSAWRTAC